MAGIQSNEIQFLIVKQTGVDSGVPTSPVFQNLRRTGGDISEKYNFTQSQEVDPTRQAAENIKIGQPIDGTLNSELSPADPLLETIVEGVLQNDIGTATNFTGATIAFANAGATIIDSGASAFADVVEGQFIGVTGSASNNRVFRVITKTSDGEVVVAPAPTDEAEGATVTIKGKMIRNGKTKQAYSVQKRTPKTGGFAYETFEGVQFGSLNLSVSAESLFSLDYSMMGLNKVDGEAAIAGQSDAATVYKRVLGSVDGLPSIWVDNVPSSSREFLCTDTSISIDNGSQGISAVGSAGYVAISHGAISVTGTFNTYIKEGDPLAEARKAKEQTIFSLALEFQDVNGNKLVITRDSTMYTSLEQPETGNGSLGINNGSVSSDGKNNPYGTIQFDFIAA